MSKEMSGKILGNIQGMFRKCSGNVQEISRGNSQEMSGKVPGNFRRSPRKWSGDLQFATVCLIFSVFTVPSVSTSSSQAGAWNFARGLHPFKGLHRAGKCPGNFVEISRKCPEKSTKKYGRKNTEIVRKFSSRYLLAISGNCLGFVKEMSGRIPEISMKFPRSFRVAPSTPFLQALYWDFCWAISFWAYPMRLVPTYACIRRSWWLGSNVGWHVLFFSMLYNVLLFLWHVFVMFCYDLLCFARFC